MNFILKFKTFTAFILHIFLFYIWWMWNVKFLFCENIVSFNIWKSCLFQISSILCIFVCFNNFMSDYCPLWLFDRKLYLKCIAYNNFRQKFIPWCLCNDCVNDCYIFFCLVSAVEVGIPGERSDLNQIPPPASSESQDMQSLQQVTLLTISLLFSQDIYIQLLKKHLKQYC